MANIPGSIGTVMPQVAVRMRTLQRALSIPGGLRVLSIVGEGRREEIIVNEAVGGGKDGFDPTFTGTSDGYGRFFKTSYYPLIENRTTLLLNGSTLKILEAAIDGSDFPSQYDARIDTDTGHIELQKASLTPYGNAYYQKGAGNQGDGYLTGLTLVDGNAPAETWTIRCVATQKDSFGSPVRGMATFTATGSVSGQLRDAYGQPYIWKSSGYAVSNGVLSFAILNPTGNIIQVGDRFSVVIRSRVLKTKDHLEARYIATLDINDPETFTDPEKLFEKHGTPGLDNTLSLGAQMAFENGATSVLAIQAKPPLPRRTSQIVLPAYDPVTGKGGASGNDEPEDLIFYVNTPGKPDMDTQVHFFVIGTDGTETQIFPNKVDFYDPDITAAFSTYETTGDSTALENLFMDPGESGMVYSYTVVSDDQVEFSGSDGQINPTGGSIGTFYSASASFDSTVVDKYIAVHHNTAPNEGRWAITGVVDQHTVTILRPSGNFAAQQNIDWQLIEEAGTPTTQAIMLTQDLKLALRQGLRVTYIDQKDADFYDANWSESLDKLETQDVQIVVALPTQTFSAIQQAFRVHVERMSTTYYKRERVLITGALEGLTPDNVTGVSEAAVEDIGVLEGIQGDDPEEILAGNIEDLADYDVKTNYGDSFRVIYMYPDEIVRVINGSRELIPGYFMAASAAGWFAGQPNFAMPLTNKILVGFTILNSRVFKETVLNNLADSGICVVQPVTGGGTVLWGKTTTQSSAPEEEEASIVFIRDRLAYVFRSVLKTFLGNPEDPTLIPTLTQKAIKLLNAFVSQNLLTAYRNLSVTRDSVEPRQYNIVVEVQPNYPVNWIFVDVSVGLF